jgi:hypothetical protein
MKKVEMIHSIVASFPRDVILRTTQIGREKRTTCTQLNNKVKPERLILSKT